MKLLCYSLSLFFAVSATAQSKVDSATLMKDVRTLSEDKYEGRKTGTRGSRMAQFYILERFKNIGLTPYNGTYEYPFYFQFGGQRVMGTNLYGYIPGKSNKVIVISAHYDHLGIEKSNNVRDTVYNGADDNASGIGGLLAMAAYFKQHPPEHTLIFAAFDAEEAGLQGAKAFLQLPPVTVSDIRLNINMDMISHNNRNELYVCGTYHYPALKTYTDAVAATSQVKLIAGHDRPGSGADDWTNQSDQGVFHGKRIPFLYFGVEDHPDYHRLTDEYSRINHSFYYRSVQTILKVAEALDAANI
ncbi:M28 family peptidase [Chitinophaga sp. Mgbs1]|uniref:M28 family peptidase n=1 Tax=Chitinophaga solisilvae TaxID=1233460 RepID=A0A433WDB6_9BACT|nr:M28 family peptidase [Chitinophaga solisilvae]